MTTTRPLPEPPEQVLDAFLSVRIDGPAELREICTELRDHGTAQAQHLAATRPHLAEELAQISQRAADLNGDYLTTGDSLIEADYVGAIHHLFETILGLNVTTEVHPTTVSDNTVVATVDDDRGRGRRYVNPALGHLLQETDILVGRLVHTPDHSDPLPRPYLLLRRDTSSGTETLYVIRSDREYAGSPSKPAARTSVQDRLVHPHLDVHHFTPPSEPWYATYIHP